ncbi:arabinan endo-1,5-alpha-L-arabinosidase [Puia sp.]|uniref:arabinan endo-1,5-alpha-L-arabinosidase n=1 Tax=Puia sp. TaxID=2045100 RepID=UPI002F425871
MRWLLIICIFISCKKGGNDSSHPLPDTTTTTPSPPPPAFDINSITDTYPGVAPLADESQWGPYNVHDPSIKKINGQYYCFSTDVAYGATPPAGIQVRRSPDLVQWHFAGWAFGGIPSIAAQYISSGGGTPNTGLWAPYILPSNGELRLYYCLASATGKLSDIALATASAPEGPWTQKGIVVTSSPNQPGTNAIDPTVVVTPSGDQWMYYGSAYDGIYIVQLNPATGLTLHPGDIGKRIANRGFTNGQYNGNIEGAEVIYHPGLKKYFLFIAYDWLTTKYNVRVARADAPDGPFYDYNGTDANTNIDHSPMIIAPYRFNGHGGWQGTAHCTVFDDGNGHFFIAHQGRPGVDFNYMDLHVRKLFWTPDGWPVASPERYAGEGDSTVTAAALTGAWEQMDLNYLVVPGYQDQQVSPNFQTSASLSIAADGTFNNNPANTWTYNAPWLSLSYAGGRTDKLFVQPGRDWENKKATLIFTGLNNTGTATWGKKQ